MKLSEHTVPGFSTGQVLAPLGWTYDFHRQLFPSFSGRFMCDSSNIIRWESLDFSHDILYMMEAFFPYNQSHVESFEVESCVNDFVKGLLLPSAKTLHIDWRIVERIHGRGDALSSFSLRNALGRTYMVLLIVILSADKKEMDDDSNRQQVEIVTNDLVRRYELKYSSPLTAVHISLALCSWRALFYPPEVALYTPKGYLTLSSVDYSSVFSLYPITGTNGQKLRDIVEAMGLEASDSLAFHYQSFSSSTTDKSFCNGDYVLALLPASPAIVCTHVTQDNFPSIEGWLERCICSHVRSDGLMWTVEKVRGTPRSEMMLFPHKRSLFTTDIDEFESLEFIKSNMSEFTPHAITSIAALHNDPQSAHPISLRTSYFCLRLLNQEGEVCTAYVLRLLAPTIASDYCGVLVKKLHYAEKLPNLDTCLQSNESTEVEVTCDFMHDSFFPTLPLLQSWSSVMTNGPGMLFRQGHLVAHIPSRCARSLIIKGELQPNGACSYTTLGSIRAQLFVEGKSEGDSVVCIWTLCKEYRSAREYIEFVCNEYKYSQGDNSEFRVFGPKKFSLESSASSQGKEKQPGNPSKSSTYSVWFQLSTEKWMYLYARESDPGRLITAQSMITKGLIFQTPTAALCELDCENLEASQQILEDILHLVKVSALKP